MTLMFSVIAFLVILSGLVLLHELGHFLVARFFGVNAEEFGIGFPPRAIGFVKEGGRWVRVGRTNQKKYAQTIWSINWLPLGGFVRLKGEMPEDEGDADSLLAQRGWKKFCILAAGVSMNWLFAAVVFSIGFMFGVPTVLNGSPASAIVTNRQIQIMNVVPGSAAEKAGLQIGDVLISLDGDAVANSAEEYRALLGERSDNETPFIVDIERNGEAMAIETKAEYLDILDRPALGVAIEDTGTVRFPFFEAIGQGVGVTARYTWAITLGFGELIRGLFNGHAPGEISGPVGIAVMTGNKVQQGLWAAAQFAAILSLNLAVLNFLPIPALDGGRAVFVALEGLRRKKNNIRTEAILHQIGFMTLMLIVLLVTIQDLRRYGGTIWQGIAGLFGG